MPGFETSLRELQLLDCILPQPPYSSFSYVVRHFSHASFITSLTRLIHSNSSLRRLDISPALDLPDFFTESQFPNLEHLFLQLSPGSANEMMSGVLYWPSLRYFDAWTTLRCTNFGFQARQRPSTYEAIASAAVSESGNASS